MSPSNGATVPGSVPSFGRGGVGTDMTPELESRIDREGDGTLESQSPFARAFQEPAEDGNPCRPASSLD